MLLFSVLVISTASFAVAQDTIVGQNCTIRGTGAPGICTLQTDCQAVLKPKQTICEWNANVPIICCEGAGAPDKVHHLAPNIQKVTTKTSGSQENSKLSISEKKCKEYWSANHTHCNQSFLIIDSGTSVNFGELTYMVAVGFKNMDEIEWNCGGTLISDQYVLTAAHCTDSSWLGPPVVVRLGELDLGNTDDGAHPIDIDIETCIRHPNHKFKFVYDDIALIKLAKKVTFTCDVRPACLWTNNRIEGSTATASGWGKTGHGEKRSLQLLKVSLDLYDRSFCEMIFRTTRHMPEGMRDSMLCAGDLTKCGRDSCKGDSGGPLVISKEGDDCAYHIIGVVSFGHMCGLNNLLGVYTKVSAYIPWIEDTVWK